jgi:hypothetical protein
VDGGYARIILHSLLGGKGKMEPISYVNVFEFYLIFTFFQYKEQFSLGRKPFDNIILKIWQSNDISISCR